MLNPEIIKKRLNRPIFIKVFSEVGSTNDEAKRHAAENAGQYVLYAAERQTSGRGRRGHSFYSPEGGLYMTLSMPVGGPPESIQRITCAAAVAVCRAIRECSGISPAVKWVNDIYVDGRKAAGILAELVCDEQNRPLGVIVGVGVNLTTRDFPDEFAGRAGAIGEVDPDILCAAIADHLIDACDDANIYSIMNEYISLNFCLGHTVSYTDSDGVHHAKAVTINSDGSLVVEENGVTHALHSGEISLCSW